MGIKLVCPKSIKKKCTANKDGYCMHYGCKDKPVKVEDINFNCAR